MTDWLLDGVLGLLLLGLAGGALHVRQLYAGVLLFVSFGLVLALVWARLGAADLALAEAAIGAGLTGVLLFAALGRDDGATMTARWAATCRRFPRRGARRRSSARGRAPPRAPGRRSPSVAWRSPGAAVSSGQGAARRSASRQRGTDPEARFSISPPTSSAMSFTASKSPGELAAKPASIMSTCIR